METTDPIYAELQNLEKIGFKTPRGSDLMLPESLKEFCDNTKKSPEYLEKVKAYEERKAQERLAEQDRQGIDYHSIALQLIDQGNLVSWKGDIYRYDDGKYIEDHGWVNKQIQDILVRREIKKTDKITSHTHEIRHHIIYHNPVQEYPFNQQTDLIPVMNGVIKINAENRKVTLEKHDPKYRFTYQIPVIFNPKATCKPIIDIFRQWVSREDVVLLLQLPAQCILQMQGITFKKAYIFEGDRDAGKTTYYQFIRLFFGKENISDVGLRDLCESRFCLAPLENKIINFHDELADVSLKHVDKFKKLTGDNWHQIERKNKEHYNAFLPAVHAFSCNYPPKIPNITDDAFWRRFEYVTFPNRFEIDPNFVNNTFTNEFLSGFLNVLIKVIVRMKRIGNKLLRDSDPESIRELWIKASDSIAAFTKEHTDKIVGQSIQKDELYRAYCDYCRTKGYKPQAKGRITSLLQQMGTYATRPRACGSRPFVYDGIGWKESSQYRLSSWNGDSLQQDLTGQTGQGIL